MVRYSEQSEEKESFSVDGVISSNDEVRRVAVRGVGGKKVGMPW
jgi:type II secretory pathway component PulC